MSTLEKIAYYQDRRDEVPNQLLAKELARDRGIKRGYRRLRKTWRTRIKISAVIA